MGLMGDKPNWEPDGDKKWLRIAIHHLTNARIAAINAMAHNVDVDPAKYTNAIDQLQELYKLVTEIEAELEKVG